MPATQYIARWMGPILFGAVQCFNRSIEGRGAIDQLRNSLSVDFVSNENSKLERKLRLKMT